MSTDAPKPSVLSFLFAEQIIQDRNTNRYTLVGIFDQIDLQPGDDGTPPWMIFTMVSDIPMKTNVESEHINLRIFDIEQNQVLHGEGKFTLKGLEAADRSEYDVASFSASFRMPIRRLNLTPGTYRVSLDLGGDVVAERPLFVVKQSGTDNE